MGATGWADNADIALGVRPCPTTLKTTRGGARPVTTIYGSTPRYSNDGVDGEKEYRYDVFPDAVELCVPDGYDRAHHGDQRRHGGWDTSLFRRRMDRTRSLPIASSYRLSPSWTKTAASPRQPRDRRALTCTPHRAAQQARCPVPEQVTIFSTFARIGTQTRRQRKARGP